MIIYYSNMSAVKGLERFIPFKIGVLDSYYHLKSPNPPPYCGNYFLDSGAFSAFRQKDPIRVEAYIEFLQRFHQDFTVYANLDVIGDYKATLINQGKIEKAGFSPLPIFHFGEPLSLLDDYCRKYDYIAFGGCVGVGGQDALNEWLTIVWSKVLSHKKGKVKVHGFGFQAVRLLQKYPWFSVDATSAHVIARYGGIYTPWGPFKINPMVNPRERDWITSTPVKFTAVRDWVESTFPNIDFSAAAANTPDGTLLRCAVNVLFFEKIAKEHSPTFSSNNKSGRLLF